MKQESEFLRLGRLLHQVMLRQAQETEARMNARLNAEVKLLKKMEKGLRKLKQERDNG